MSLATRIVSRTETGQLQLHVDDLQRILKSVFQRPSLPVSILCVTGPRGSGKSFYANLLLEYLRAPENASWLHDLCKIEKGTACHGKILRGFSYGNTEFPVPTGVYMWPSPFRALSGFVWILDIHINEDDKVVDGEDPLELYINLICSKIVEIIWKDGVSSNKLCRQFLREHNAELTKICTNQTFLFRKTTAESRQPKFAVNPKQYSDDLSFANHVEVWDPETTLHTPTGCLTIGKLLEKDLANIPAHIFGDSGNFWCKQVDNGKPLTLFYMKDFLQASVNKVNQILAKAQTRKFSRNTTLQQTQNCGIFPQQSSFFLRFVKSLMQPTSSAASDPNINATTSKERETIVRASNTSTASTSEGPAADLESIERDDALNSLKKASEHFSTAKFQLDAQIKRIEEERQMLSQQRESMRQEKQALAAERRAMFSERESFQQEITAAYENLNREKVEFAAARLRLEAEKNQIKEARAAITKSFETWSSTLGKSASPSEPKKGTEHNVGIPRVNVETRKSNEQLETSLNLPQASSANAKTVNDPLGRIGADVKVLKEGFGVANKNETELLEKNIEQKIATKKFALVNSTGASQIDTTSLLVGTRRVKEETDLGETEIPQTFSKIMKTMKKDEMKIDETNGLRFVAKSNQLKSPLFPLVAQLSLTGIRLGCWKTESDFNVLQDTSIPMVVGITKENRWVCGESAMKPYQGTEPRVPREDLQNLWRIGEYFLSGEEKPWSEQVKIDDSVYEIGLEFLLGMLLLRLKQRTEATVYLKFDEILVTVPFWFTSAHRQQVKDSGRIAGFENVFILNENSAAAWGHCKSLKRGSYNYELMVLSENSGLVDVTIFGYDPTLEVQTMVGHSGNYQLTKRFKPGVFSKFLKKVAAACPYSQSALKEPTKDDQTRRYERVREARKQAQEMSDRFGSKNSQYPVHKVGIFTSEYPTWKNLLARVATECDSLAVDVSDHLFLLGAGYISQDPSLIGRSIKDRLSLDLVWSTRDDNGTTFSSTDDKLSAKKTVEQKLPNWQTDQIQFFQCLMGAAIPVGVLDIKTITAYHVPRAYLQIDPDGIISFNSLLMKKHGYAPFFLSPYDATDKDFMWRKGNITEEKSTTALSLLEHITQREAREHEQFSALQALIDTGNRILLMIARGEGSFRSDLGRNMIKNQVQEALGVINHPKFDMKDIKKQNDVFKGVQEKYFSE